MEIILNQKPKSPIMIEGFPGFGFVSTITTEFLIEHLNAKLIGRFEDDRLAPMVAIHNTKLIEPLGIYYDKSHNILIFHTVTNLQGLEWEIASKLTTLSRDLKAKELISIEGVASQSEETNAYYYACSPDIEKKFNKIKIQPLKEGIIMGVTSALLLKARCPISAVFVETHSNLPDSRAAAKVIEVLDKYLNLNVDYKPLLAKAEQFETKIKSIMEQQSQAKEQKDRKELSYFG